MPDYRYIVDKRIEGYSFSRHIFQIDILDIEVSNEEIKEFEQNENCSEESCGKNTANAKLKVVKLLEVLERSDSI